MSITHQIGFIKAARANGLSVRDSLALAKYAAGMWPAPIVPTNMYHGAGQTIRPRSTMIGNRLPQPTPSLASRPGVNPKNMLGLGGASPMPKA